MGELCGQLDFGLSTIFLLCPGSATATTKYERVHSQDDDWPEIFPDFLVFV